MVQGRVWLAMAVWIGLTPPAEAEEIRISHDPALCVLVDVFPRLRACVQPHEGLARPRAYFRAEGDGSWYYVEMRRDGDCHVAVLPKPLAEARRVEYYAFAQSARPPFPQAQTPVHLAEVRSGATGCGTPFETSAKVRAIPAAGSMRAPSGFAADGLQGLPKPERRMGAAGLVIGGGAAAASAVVAGAVLVKNSGAEPDVPVSSAPATETPTPTSAPAPSTRAPTPTPAPDGPSDPPPTLPPTTPTPTLPPTTLPPTTLPPTTLLPTLLSPTLVPRITLPGVTLLEKGGDTGDVARAAVRPLSCRLTGLVPGTRGQIVLNSAAAWFSTGDVSIWRHPAKAGVNRLELLVVEGSAGLWRLELLPDTPLRAGSLRVLAGAVDRVEDRAIVLRIAGQPGERALVVFELE